MLVLSINQLKQMMWVKRVIGRPGDTLEFKDGHVWRNGEELQEPYTKIQQ